MTGTVFMINRRRSVVAFRADTGTSFTVVEITVNDPVDLGDRIVWHTDGVRPATYFNETKMARFGVNVPDRCPRRQRLTTSAAA